MMAAHNGAALSPSRTNGAQRECFVMRGSILLGRRHRDLLTSTPEPSPSLPFPRVQGSMIECFR